MQAPTHILAGIIIRRAFGWRYYRFFAVLFTILAALFFQGVFDKLGKAVYGPETIDFNDPFWLIYHIAMWLLSIVMLYVYWGEYKLGIVFSLLPDVDWIVLGIQNAIGKELIFYKQPLIHNALNYILDITVPFNYLNLLPDQRNNALACLWEVLLFALLMLIFRLQLSRRRNIHF